VPGQGLVCLRNGEPALKFPRTADHMDSTRRTILATGASAKSTAAAPSLLAPTGTAGSYSVASRPPIQNSVGSTGALELLICRLDSQHGAIGGVATNCFFRGHKQVAIGTLHDVANSLLKRNKEPLPLLGL
jgi:hypothetical protein